MKTDKQMIDNLKAKVNIGEATERVAINLLTTKSNEVRKQLEEMKKELIYQLFDRIKPENLQNLKTFISLLINEQFQNLDE